MKLIWASNFGLETISDILIASNLNEYYGKIFVEYLKDQTHPNSTYWPVLVEDDYELYVWEP